jgi:Lecithin retinol acyltransferase
MSRGDHVYVRRRRLISRYTHHGIDCGDATVIHYAGDPGTVRRVERTSMEEFAVGAQVFVRPGRRQLPAEEVVANAESRLGSDGYHLVWNNCEHFATWASTGSAASKQVRGWVAAGPGAVASMGAAEATGVHVMVLGTFGMGIYALARPLRRRRHRGSQLPVDV